MVDESGRTGAQPDEATITNTFEASSAEDIKKEEIPTVLAPELEVLRRVPFGSRYLTNPDDVFSFNAWDHVVPPPEWEDEAKETLAKQRAAKVTQTMKNVYNSKPALYWDRFYNIHTASFFKDRNWLKLEFPELWECARAEAGPKTVVEIGCGAGNTVFPLLTHNVNPHLVVHACDYSKSAVEVVKSNPLYPVPDHGYGILHASVWDLSTPPVLPSASEALPAQDATTSLPEGVKENSVDVAILIFVMSALHPREWQRAIANCYKVWEFPTTIPIADRVATQMLKPNGLLLIRDYGRYDLAQLRIKKGRMLEENFYIRGDGTRVYFFEAAELSEMLTGSKTAFTPQTSSQPTVEVENDSALPEAVQADSPMPGTPVEEQPQYQTPTDLASSIGNLSTSDECEAGPSRPLSTRFRTPPPTPVPAPAVGARPNPLIAPRDAYPSLDGPVAGAADADELPEGVERIDPFTMTPEELGVPENPLFVIDQLGVDRRMIVNRKRQLKMYRIWMQVKARKLVPDAHDERTLPAV